MFVSDGFLLEMRLLGGAAGIGGGGGGGGGGPGEFGDGGSGPGGRGASCSQRVIVQTVQNTMIEMNYVA